jgi:hypothetical protein
MKIESSPFKEVDPDNYVANMDAYWLPYTPNRYFKNKPKIKLQPKGFITPMTMVASCLMELLGCGLVP